MTVEEARTARSRRLILGVAGAFVVVAAFFWFRRSDIPEPTQAPGDQRAGARSSDPERVSRKPASSPGAQAGSPDEDDRDEAAEPPVERPDAPPSAVEEGPEDDPLRPVRAAMADPSDKGTQALVARLASTDEVVVAEAANALVARKAVDTIPWIAKIDLKTAAGSGLSIIDALGRLGAVADSGGRSAAVDRLLSMLAEEKKRGARESPANLLQIYEALGKLGDPRAAHALEAELLDPNVPRAPKVVIVKSLVAIGQQESRGALVSARAQQVAGKGEDDFEEEIRKELIGEIDRALQEL